MKIKILDTDKNAISLLILIFVIIYFITYSKWNILLVDAFHDIYVPWQMIEGKMLYKDIIYLYGPLVPYLHKLIFSFLGININIIYILGGTATLIYTLALYFISRQVLDIKKTFLVILTFWCICAFTPGNKNFILPYVQSASYGVTLAIGSLACLIHYYNKNTKLYLCLATILTGLTFITKIEYALAIILTWFIFILACKYWSKINLKPIIICFICIFIIPITVYGALINQIGFNHIKNILIPTQYLGASQYFHSHLVKSGFSTEIILSALIAFVLFLLVFSITVFAFYNYFNLKETKPYATLIIFSLVIIALCILLITFNMGPQLLSYHLKIFAGLNFLTTILIITKFKKAYDDKRIQILLLISFFSLFISLRSIFYLNLEAFASFYLPTTLIVLYYFIYEVLPELLPKKIELKHYNSAVNIFVISVILLFTIKDIGLYLRKNQVISYSNIGFITVDNRYGIAFSEILDFIINNSTISDKIYVIPEEVSIYVLTKRSSPTKYYYLNPGVFGNSEEKKKALLNELENNKPKFIVTSNLPQNDFLKKGTRKNYYNFINTWIANNYRKVKLFKTSYPVDSGLYYEIIIWQKNDNI